MSLRAFAWPGTSKQQEAVLPLFEPDADEITSTQGKAKISQRSFQSAGTFYNIYLIRPAIVLAKKSFRIQNNLCSKDDEVAAAAADDDDDDDDADADADADAGGDDDDDDDGDADADDADNADDANDAADAAADDDDDADDADDANEC